GSGHLVPCTEGTERGGAGARGYRVDRLGEVRESRRRDAIRDRRQPRLVEPVDANRVLSEHGARRVGRDPAERVALRETRHRFRAILAVLPGSLDVRIVRTPQQLRRVPFRHGTFGLERRKEARTDEHVGPAVVAWTPW